MYVEASYAKSKFFQELFSEYSRLSPTAMNNQQNHPNKIHLIAGIDEAGRGPLAGPVVAAAVILDPLQPIDGLADSKILSKLKRESLAKLIKAQALSWSIAVASVEEIDELNNRIGEIETLMNDTDKDGVPDYLDVENNSIAGVSVDTKGRMVDKNGNGVPDDLEKYVDSAIANQTILNNNNNKQLTEDIIIKLINEGYIVAYFDSEKAQPNN